jgi:hypothetical protein
VSKAGRYGDDNRNNDNDNRDRRCCCRRRHRRCYRRRRRCPRLSWGERIQPIEFTLLQYYHNCLFYFICYFGIALMLAALLQHAAMEADGRRLATVHRAVSACVASCVETVALRRRAVQRGSRERLEVAAEGDGARRSKAIGPLPAGSTSMIFHSLTMIGI